MQLIGPSDVGEITSVVNCCDSDSKSFSDKDACDSDSNDVSSMNSLLDSIGSDLKWKPQNVEPWK